MKPQPPKRKRGRPFKDKAKSDQGVTKPLPPRFFTVILPCTLQENKLRLPVKFARNFNSEFETVASATLSVPTGLTWKVAVNKSDNKFYFTQGMQQFMKHYSVRLGYFLQFEYRGNHHFRVHIFDLSCCEIEYPLKNDLKDCPSKEEPVKVQKEEEENETKCENPSFTILVRKSNFTRNGLYVPIEFAKKYLITKKKKSVKLKSDDGREWHLRCFYRKSKTSRSVDLVNGSGWKSFFKVGEMVTFEMVDESDDDITLKYFKR